MPAPIIYEHPLQEETRILLRIESYLTQIESAVKKSSAELHKGSVMALSELLQLCSRADLKKIMIGSLYDVQNWMNALHSHPRVANQSWRETMDALQREVDAWLQYNSDALDVIRQDGLIRELRKQVNSQSGLCDFNMPIMNMWMSGYAKDRVEQLRAWNELFSLHRATTQRTLGLLRQSALFRQCVATENTFQQPLDPKKDIKLIRLTLPKKSPCFPVISANPHRLHMQLYAYPEVSNEGRPTSGPINFSICLCSWHVPENEGVASHNQAAYNSCTL